MKHKYPIKYVARAILRSGKEVQYFSSPAYIKDRIREYGKSGDIDKYVIEYCEKYGDERIEDYPYSTGYYYGYVFDDKPACDKYVEELNIRFPFLNKRELQALEELKRNSSEKEPS